MYGLDKEGRPNIREEASWEIGSTNWSTQNLSHIEQQVGTAVQEIITHLDAEGKRLASFIAINKAVEFQFGKDKSAILVYFSYFWSHSATAAIKCSSHLSTRNLWPNSRKNSKKPCFCCQPETSSRDGLRRTELKSDQTAELSLQSTLQSLTSYSSPALSSVQELESDSMAPLLPKLPSINLNNISSKKELMQSEQPIADWPIETSKSISKRKPLFTCLRREKRNEHDLGYI